MRRRRSLPRDPSFITARYAGTCGSPPCGAAIHVGDRVFHYPSTNITLCTGCSEAAARRFQAEVADEASCVW